MTGHGGVIAIREEGGSVIVCLLTHCTESSSFTVVVTGKSKIKKSKVNFGILYQLKFKKVEQWTQKFAKSFAGVSTISGSCISAFSLYKTLIIILYKIGEETKLNHVNFYRILRVDIYSCLYLNIMMMVLFIKGKGTYL